MGCADSSVKQNVVIQISYCGSCGWTEVAKNVCDAVKKELPGCTIDCRPQAEYTGLLKASLLIDKSKRKQIYEGSKKQTNQQIQQVATKVMNAYKNS